jgi:hypothetical protein
MWRFAASIFSIGGHPEQWAYLPYYSGFTLNFGKGLFFGVTLLFVVLGNLSTGWGLFDSPDTFSLHPMIGDRTR